MAEVSNETAVKEIPLIRLLDLAYRRFGKSPSTIAPETMNDALDILFMMVNSWPNMGATLWSMEPFVMGYLPGMARNYLPKKVMDLVDDNMMHRTNVRAVGSFTSSAGGTVANAYDDDLDTSCNQATADGSFTFTATSAVKILSVGISSNGAATYTLRFDISDDGTTWTTIQTNVAKAFDDRVPGWIDVPDAREANYFRVTEIGGATLRIRELILVEKITEINVYRGNKDDYISLPNKSFSGYQVTTVWFDRQIPRPILWIWPTPQETSFVNALLVWVRNQVMDPGDYTMDGNQIKLNIPDRWLRPAYLHLAMELAKLMPDEEVQARVPSIENDYAKALADVQKEERDNAPSLLTPDISRYTRF